VFFCFLTNFCSQNREVLEANIEGGKGTYLQVGEVVRFSCETFVNGIPARAKVSEILYAAPWNHSFSEYFEKQGTFLKILRGEKVVKNKKFGSSSSLVPFFRERLY
jgi:hypothetical protein